MMTKRKGYFAVHSYGRRWICLLTLMLLVFSPHVDGQQGRARPRRVYPPSARDQKVLGTIKSK